MESFQCVSYTKEGKQCTRPSLSHSSQQLCWQHERATGKKIFTTTEREPWERLGIIIAPSTENTPRALQKLRVLLRRGPTKLDCDGHIYVYTCQSDKENPISYYKVGRTARDTRKRVEKEQGGNLKRSWRTGDHKFAEALIHSYLSYCRVYRYPHHRGFHSIWQRNGKTIEDGQNLPGGPPKHKARKKQVEWFACEWEHLERLIGAILKAIPYWKRRIKKLEP
jgi:T5orf172 domain